MSHLPFSPAATRGVCFAAAGGTRFAATRKIMSRKKTGLLSHQETCLLLLRQRERCFLSLRIACHFLQEETSLLEQQDTSQSQYAASSCLWTADRPLNPDKCKRGWVPGEVGFVHLIPSTSPGSLQDLSNHLPRTSPGPGEV